MRHRKEGKKFNRKTGPRRHFVRNLVNDLVRQGRIETTVTRAKTVRPAVEKLITLGKKQTLASRRLLVSRMGNASVANKLYEEIAPRYAKRPGGYTRITTVLRPRKRDSAPVAIIEFI